jgi:hypothetical protein
MKVRVIGHYRVVHDGQAYGPGDVADVPDKVAKRWLLYQWVESAEPQPEPAPEPAEHDAPESEQAEPEQGTEPPKRRGRR